MAGACAFNSVLTASCVLDELEVGVACMGIIEYAFAGISAVIGKTVVQRGWVSAERLVHYKLHAEIDERHAEEFFAVIEPAWDDDAAVTTSSKVWNWGPTSSIGSTATCMRRVGKNRHCPGRLLDD